MYTVNAAYANFGDSFKGIIGERKLGDMVVLSDDPFETKPEKIRDVKVLITVVGGQMSARMGTIQQNISNVL